MNEDYRACGDWSEYDKLEIMQTYVPDSTSALSLCAASDKCLEFKGLVCLSVKWEK
jgi:hypothetical protein